MRHIRHISWPSPWICLTVNMDLGHIIVWACNATNMRLSFFSFMLHKRITRMQSAKIPFGMDCNFSSPARPKRMLYSLLHAKPTHHHRLWLFHFAHIIGCPLSFDPRWGFLLLRYTSFTSSPYTNTIPFCFLVFDFVQSFPSFFVFKEKNVHIACMVVMWCARDNNEQKMYLR